MYYGENCDAAFDAVRRLRHTSDLLATLDVATAERALDRLRASLAAHHTSDGVLFDSRAWIVTARSLDTSPHR